MQMAQLILCKLIVLLGEFLAARVTAENASQEIKDNQGKKAQNLPRKNYKCQFKRPWQRQLGLYDVQNKNEVQHIMNFMSTTQCKNCVIHKSELFPESNKNIK